MPSKCFFREWPIFLKRNLSVRIIGAITEKQLDSERKRSCVSKGQEREKDWAREKERKREREIVKERVRMIEREKEREGDEVRVKKTDKRRCPRRWMNQFCGKTRTRSCRTDQRINRLIHISYLWLRQTWSSSASSSPSGWCRPNLDFSQSRLSSSFSDRMEDTCARGYRRP